MWSRYDDYIVQMLKIEQEQIILRQLVSDYRQIVFQFGLKLQVPLLRLTDLENVWGRWDPYHRSIEIRRQLVFENSWDTVLYVLKHEMAHQIVSEMFGLFDSDHKESFQRACDMLSLPPEFRNSSTDLKESQSWKNASEKKEAILNIVSRIQKLLALASSTNEAEASLALSKAHELMSKYNVHQSVVFENPEAFKYSIFDTKKVRLSAVYSHLASLLINYYNVDIIFTKTFNVPMMNQTQVLEIYGRESNVLIADYVLDFLLRTVEYLWKEHSLRTKADARAKKSFQLGVIEGFKQKLQKISDPENPQSQGLVVKKDLQIKEKKALKEYVALRYPRLKSRSSGNRRIDRGEFEMGKIKGASLDIRNAIRSKGQKIKSLLSIKNF